MGNVRSLGNKMDELTSLAQSQKEYHECNLMCFMETWLHQDVPDDNTTIKGFYTVHTDRYSIQSGKRKGRGLAVLVNSRWCNPLNITMKECICCPDAELFAVRQRPHYLPREFSHVIMVAVYVPPSANLNIACEIIHSAITQIQTHHPSAFIAISVDFNQECQPGLYTSNFYPICELSQGRTIDLMYVKEAYSSSPLPPLGRSDHNLIHLTPCYMPIVKRLQATTKTVRRWTDEDNETVQGCFQVTDWQAVFEPHGDDIDRLTECITGYINFCVDTIVPTRNISYYPNNKPWVTKYIKATYSSTCQGGRRGQ